MLNISILVFYCELSDADILKLALILISIEDFFPAVFAKWYHGSIHSDLLQIIVYFDRCYILIS